MQTEKVIDMQEYKHINMKERTYTYDEAVDLACSIADRKARAEKEARKAQFWDEMFVAIPMASVFIALWFALLLGF